MRVKKRTNIPCLRPGQVYGLKKGAGRWRKLSDPQNT